MRILVNIASQGKSAPENALKPYAIIPFPREKIREINTFGDGYIHGGVVSIITPRLFLYWNRIVNTDEICLGGTRFETSCGGSRCECMA